MSVSLLFASGVTRHDPSTTLALLAALYHYKDINEPERLGEDMGHGDHNGSGAGADNAGLDAQARGQNAEPDAFEDGDELRDMRDGKNPQNRQHHYED